MNKQLVISRIEYEKLIAAGLKNGEYTFVETIVSAWLNSFPSDLPSELHLARVLNLQKKRDEAIKHITQILMRDPEFIDAYRLMSELGGNVDNRAVKSFLYILGGTTADISTIYPWAVTLRAVRMSIRKNDLDNTEKMLNNLLDKEAENPLVAIAHSLFIKLKQNPLNSLTIIQGYHQKWPECLQFSIMLAELLMKKGKEPEAIDLLHKCVSFDPSGQVVRRLLGEKHEFISLWVHEQTIILDTQIPSSVAVSLNWNKLSAGNKPIGFASEKNGYKSREHYLDNEAKNQDIPKGNKHKRKSVWSPVYVILSTRTGLENKYGKRTAEIIIEELTELSKVVNRKKHWSSIVFMPDDSKRTNIEEVEQINSIDPWKIKLSLNDLDKQLKKQSMMIGAVIIVGGHEIVPFHKLPNPTDDSDDGVLSDNPYSTSSGNYLVPEWPVGRLPDEAGKDAGLLLEQIRHIITFHQNTLKNKNLLDHIISTLLDKTEIRRFLRDIISPPKNFGYSAAVWRRSSLSAFRPIGSGASLRITPPYLSETIDVENLMKSKCAFFNLHGLSNTPEWYGQRDFSEEPKGPDFPVAISTKEIIKYRNNVDLTFSEACYGGYVINKKIDDSIALKLIAIGSQGLVASTCIAYGSVFPPLIGADLLASIFWKYNKDGYSFGESLMQAKINLVKVMGQRQGYLDGEDQKTLASFVLYGDPLGYLEENIYLEKQMPISKEQYRFFETYSDQDGYVSNSPRLSNKIISDINQVVESYIPNLDNADIKIRELQIRMDKIIRAGEGKNGGRELEGSDGLKTRTQITYSQKLKAARMVHEQFARVTLDESGKVIKLAVSR